MGICHPSPVDSTHCRMFFIQTFLIPFIGSSTITNPETKSTSFSRCPSDNDWIDASIVMMGCLLFDTSKEYNWEEALTRCEDLGATLMEIRNEAAMQFVRIKLNFMIDDEFPRSWWTSAVDMFVECDWFWLSNGGDVADWTWSPGRPTRNRTRNCQILDPGLDIKYMGSDTDCSGKNYPICQMEGHPGMSSN